MIRKKNQASFRLRNRAASLALGSLSLGLALGWTPSASAAALAPRIKLDSGDLKRPIVLDQTGQWVRPSVGAAAQSSVPTYVGFPVDKNGSVLDGFTMINTGPRIPGQTVGPLHLNADTRGRLDTTLAQDGRAIVQTASQTMLVKPAGAFTEGDQQTRLSAWLSAQASARATTPPPSTQPKSQDLAQILKLDKLGQTISDLKFVKDIRQFLSPKSSNSAGGHAQGLNKLKRDVKLAAPKAVASTTEATGSGAGSAAAAGSGQGTAVAQTLDGPATTAELSEGGLVLAAPVPEPSTYLIFGLGGGALALRRRLGRRRASA